MAEPAKPGSCGKGVLLSFWHLVTFPGPSSPSGQGRESGSGGVGDRKKQRQSESDKQKGREGKTGREGERHGENPLKARTGSQSLVRHQSRRQKSCLINRCSLGKVFLIPSVD